MEKIKVIIKRPDEQYGHTEWIRNTLNAMMDVVGSIVTIAPLDEGLIMIYNKYRYARRSEKNIYLDKINEMIYGTVVITGIDKDGFAISIPDQGMNCWKQKLDEWKRRREEK